MIITARYDVFLPAFLMFCVANEISKDISFKFKVDDYDLEIQVIVDRGAGYKSKDDKHTTYGASRLIVKVRHDEQGDLDYFKSRISEIYQPFEQAAEIGINRLIRFFQYKLNNPLLREVSCHDDPWSNNPKWYDSQGNEIDLGVVTSDYSRHLAYGYYPKFGMKALQDIDDPAFNDALAHGLEAEIYEEVLSNARTDIIEENYGRAVLEMAIGCEVFVKSKLFAASRVSGAIFDYLSAQRKIEVSIQELIHRPLKEAFGGSFREDHPIDYKNIGRLFQARNRVAHSGRCSFRDDKGNEVDVDELVLEDWWKSIQALQDWLKTKITVY